MNVVAPDWGLLLSSAVRARSLEHWLTLLFSAFSHQLPLTQLMVVQWQQRQPRLIAEYDGTHCYCSNEAPLVQPQLALPLDEILPIANGADMHILALESSASTCLIVPLTLDADTPTALCLCGASEPSGQLLTIMTALQRPLADTFFLMLELERLSELRKRSQHQHGSSIIELQPLIDNAPAMIAVTDLTGKMLFTNRSFDLIKTINGESAAGANLFKAFSKEQASQFWHNNLTVLQQRKPMEFEELVEHADGSLHTYLSMKFPLFDSDNEIWALAVVATDISDRKHAEQQLRESEQRLRVLLRHAPDAILIYDIDQQRYIDANRTAEQLFGLSRETLLQLSPDDLSPLLQQDGQNSAELRQKQIKIACRGDAPRFEWQYRHNDGRLLNCEVAFVTLPMGNRRILRESLIDIGRYKSAERQLREQEKRLAHIAHHDPLTGLPNRLLLYDRLSHSLEVARRNGSRVGVMLIDLDKFKEINDRLGHDAGDRYLTTVAKRMRQPLRAMDTAARIGGDEFVVTVECFNVLDDLAHIASKLLDQIGQPLTLNGQAFSPGLSIGISVFPDDANNPEALLKHADIAMYRAKEAGGRQFRFYTGTIGHFHQHSAQLERDLRDVTTRDELQLVFQPVVDLASGEVTCLESLLRWHHPRRGVLVAADFLPLAEDNDMIWEIDRWVINQLFEQWQQWHHQSPMPRLALNLSTHQLQQQQTLRALDELLAQQPEFAQILDIEMSEHLLMDGSDATEHLLHSLAAKGVRLAIDDFGCGCMQLARLQKLPISHLKLGSKIINRVPEARGENAMVCGILAMAHSLGLHCVAKGVERDAQRQFLLEYGCREAQGYLLAKPQIAADCQSWLAPHPQLYLA